MSRVNGQLVTCDRCGQTVFLKTIGEGELDGGYTRWNKFDPFPTGWSVKSGLGDLCPDCSREWNRIETDFMNKKLEFMKQETGGEEC